MRKRQDFAANACGRSTLLKTLARLVQPISGEILLDGKQIGSIPSKQLAQKIGLLPLPDFLERNGYKGLRGGGRGFGNHGYQSTG